MAELGDESLPMVEIIDETNADVSVGPHGTSVHAWIRTAAAAITAGGVLWGASALSASRAADEKLACLTELQVSMFLPGVGNDVAFDPNDLRENVTAAAEGCDLAYLRAALDAAGEGN